MAAAGYADACEAKILDDLSAAGVVGPVRPVQELRQARRLPPWLGDEYLHHSYRLALVRKDLGFYRPRLGDVPPDLPYVCLPDSPASRLGGQGLGVAVYPGLDRCAVPPAGPLRAVLTR